MFGTYQRLRVPVSATPREVISATRRKFKRGVRRDPSFREARKAVYRDMLHYHAEARALVRMWNL